MCFYLISYAISSSDSGSRTPRRKSFYNFFLRHQDAVDDTQSIIRKSPIPSSGQPLSAANSFDEKQLQGTITAAAAAAAATTTTTTPTPSTSKTKRATSFVRKKPPFERGLSAQSALRINKNAHVGK